MTGCSDNIKASQNGLLNVRNFACLSVTKTITMTNFEYARFKMTF